MDKVIKASIPSRHASLVSGDSTVVLFSVDGCVCQAMYLEQTQSHSAQTSSSLVALVYDGGGEIAWEEGGQSVVLPLIKGDVVFIPRGVTYTVTNVLPGLLSIGMVIITR